MYCILFILFVDLILFVCLSFPQI